MSLYKNAAAKRISNIRLPLILEIIEIVPCSESDAKPMWFINSIISQCYNAVLITSVYRLLVYGLLDSHKQLQRAALSFFFSSSSKMRNIKKFI